MIVLPASPSKSASCIVTLLLLIGCSTLSGGCSFAPSSTDAANADYGLTMSESEARALADQYLVRHLKDPDSRRIQWQGFGKAWYWNGVHGNQFGYGVSALVNAKNSFGGYVGNTPYFFLCRDGKLLWAVDDYSPQFCGFTQVE